MSLGPLKAVFGTDSRMLVSNSYPSFGANASDFCLSYASFSQIIRGCWHRESFPQCFVGTLRQRLLILSCWQLELAEFKRIDRRNQANGAQEYFQRHALG